MCVTIIIAISLFDIYFLNIINYLKIGAGVKSAEAEYQRDYDCDDDVFAHNI